MKYNNIKKFNIKPRKLYNSKLTITDKEIEVVVNDCVIFKGKVTKENFKYVQKMIKLSGGYIINKK